MFAQTPPPPYYAVIFASQRPANDAPDADDGYAATADRMVDLAQHQPGFLGADSARDAFGFGITVSYWTDEAAIRAWKANLEHLAAQAEGRARWYSGFELRVAKVERAYGMPVPCF